MEQTKVTPSPPGILITHDQIEKIAELLNKAQGLDTVLSFKRLEVPAQARIRIGMYYANLMQMDDRLGAVPQALRELELEQDTIVVYTSDHGERAGDKGLSLRFVMYEGSVGVPLMFRVPGLTDANRRYSANSPSVLSVETPSLALCRSSTSIM